MMENPGWNIRICRQRRIGFDEIDGVEFVRELSNVGIKNIIR